MYDEEYGSKFKRVGVPIIIGIISGLAIFGLLYLVFFTKTESKNTEPTPTPYETPQVIEPTPVATDDISTPIPTTRPTTKPTAKPTATPIPTTKPTATPTPKPTPKPTATPSVSFGKNNYVCGKGSTITVKTKICQDILKDVSSENKKIATANVVVIYYPTGQINDTIKCGSTSKCITDSHNQVNACQTYESNVKCVAAGTTNINVKTGTGLKAKASVKVVDKYVSVKSVHIDDYNRTIKVGDKFTLTANVDPSNASNKKVYWTTSDKSVLTVDSSGNVKAVKSGKAKITAKVYYDDTKSYSDSVEYRVYAKESELAANDLVAFARNSGSCKAGKEFIIGFHMFMVPNSNVSGGALKEIKSQNTAIATVGKNMSDEYCYGCYKYMIKCKKAGTTKLEVTTTKGGKATYTLTVK